jgi:hypothetical protein
MAAAVAATLEASTEFSEIPEIPDAFYPMLEDVLQKVKTINFQFSRFSELFDLQKLAQGLTNALSTGEVTVKKTGQKFKLTSYYMPFDEFKECYLKYIPDEYKKSPYFWILFAAQFDELLLHEECIPVLKSAKGREQEVFLYFFGSVLGYPEYKEVFDQIISNEHLSKLTLFAKELFNLDAVKDIRIGNKILAKLPDEVKTLPMYIIGGWRSPDCVKRSDRPDEDFLLGHIPRDVQENEFFKIALDCGKNGLRLPKEVLDFLFPID